VSQKLFLSPRTQLEIIHQGAWRLNYGLNSTDHLYYSQTKHIYKDSAGVPWEASVLLHRHKYTQDVALSTVQFGAVQ
jgi:hypothetical protein